MPDSLPVLETQRAAIQQKIAQLGDMRSGSITTTGGRCAVTPVAIAMKKTILAMDPFTV